MLRIKLMKEFYNGKGLTPGTIVQRVFSAGFSTIKSLFTKQLNVNPEVNCPHGGVVDSLRYLICNENLMKPYSEEHVLATLLTGTSALFGFIPVFITIDKSVTPVWCYIFSVMVTAVFYCPFLHVFYAADVFHGTVFMYNHAILCIFAQNLEVEINIIIIIIITINIQ